MRGRLPFIHTCDESHVSLILLGPDDLDGWLSGRGDSLRAWVAESGFKGAEDSVCLIPSLLINADARKEGLGAVLVGLGSDFSFWTGAALPQKLPEGRYRVDSALTETEANHFALAWALGSYRFERYQAEKKSFSRWLVWPDAAEVDTIKAQVEAIFLTRDLINTPTNDMGPPQLSDGFRQLAQTFGADFSETLGDDLLTAHYPAIHAVGRASSSAPRLLDLRWGQEGPLVTLVGKGVCFDTGGLDIKPAPNMLLMKKDMAGAAHVVGLAYVIMATKLPCRLRVLVPAVENAIAGNAFRPGDVLQTRKGMTVEVGNTDAEGRLVLCDALWEASREEPDLLVDFATLTGAARVALGTDLPALFSNSDDLAAQILKEGEKQEDPLWRLPLHRPYRKLLNSKIADISNVSPSGFGGAITAALYLEEFVSDRVSWAHIDLMAWNNTSRAGRPEGGEAMAMRAVYAAIRAFILAREKNTDGGGG